MKELGKEKDHKLMIFGVANSISMSFAFPSVTSYTCEFNNNTPKDLQNRRHAIASFIQKTLLELEDHKCQVCLYTFGRTQESSVSGSYPYDMLAFNECLTQLESTSNLVATSAVSVVSTKILATLNEHKGAASRIILFLDLETFVSTSHDYFEKFAETAEICVYLFGDVTQFYEYKEELRKFKPSTNFRLKLVAEPSDLIFIASPFKKVLPPPCIFSKKAQLYFGNLQCAVELVSDVATIPYENISVVGTIEADEMGLRYLNAPAENVVFLYGVKGRENSKSKDVTIVSEEFLTTFATALYDENAMALCNCRTREKADALALLMATSLTHDGKVKGLMFLVPAPSEAHMLNAFALHKETELGTEIKKKANEKSKMSRVPLCTSEIALGSAVTQLKKAIDQQDCASFDTVIAWIDKELTAAGRDMSEIINYIQDIETEGDIKKQIDKWIKEMSSRLK
ncbi:unnamed protein product [Caenorhabditis auriculariae]|uniref:Uncharacterized protein n=1 Tax=Caenorhabditis auriculariae TaxID=2777116 RepID=A0A8S1H8P6_9PELO|nr:unnamed protein product [Caenorhabditis auriculariae]